MVKRREKCNDGKLDTYFTIKQELNAEPYWRIEKFLLRKAVGKLRISAHNLMIKDGRYAKPRILPRSERICIHCNFNCIENEFNYLSQCLFNESERIKLYNQMQYKNNNLMSLCDILLQEDENILFTLGTYTHS